MGDGPRLTAFAPLAAEAEVDCSDVFEDVVDPAPPSYPSAHHYLRARVAD